MNIIGNVYGRWTVLGFSGKRGPQGKTPYWLCRCECGTIRDVAYPVLTSKIRPSRSCGCLIREITSKRSKTHGMRSSREYVCWTSMKDRCYNRRSPNFADYGGRGISVCDRWRVSFENFYTDMGQRPYGHTLGRINNNDSYFKENCRWETITQQNRNKRSTILITYNEESLIVPDWSIRLNVPKQTIYARFYKGWSDVECLFGRIVNE